MAPSSAWSTTACHHHMLQVLVVQCVSVPVGRAQRTHVHTCCCNEWLYTRTTCSRLSVYSRHCDSVGCGRRRRRKRRRRRSLVMLRRSRWPPPAGDRLPNGRTAISEQRLLIGWGWGTLRQVLLVSLGTEEQIQITNPLMWAGNYSQPL